jgi:hypothetical protein
MIATSHVIIGGAVGTAVGVATGSLTAALVAGVVSHLVCDLIPHIDHPPAPFIDGELQWTKGVYIFAITDSAIAGLVTLFFWFSFFSFPLITPFIMGAIGGYLPDFVDNVPFWNTKTRQLPGLREFHELHDDIHAIWKPYFPMPKNWLIGISTQITLAGASLLYLLKP